MRLRRANVAESEEIAGIFRLTRQTSMPFLPILHTLDEDKAFFRFQVFPACEVWVVDEDGIKGLCAFREGWLDHLYVHPQFQRCGFGRALLDEAKARFCDLQLWLFQRNQIADVFYRANGFRLLQETDGAANEEREPDALYRWSRR